MKRREFWYVLGGLLPVRLVSQEGQLTAEQKRALAEAQRDPVLTAMLAEIRRMGELRTMPEIPYYIEVGCDDAQIFTVSATLGAAFAPQSRRVRPLRVQVRVGSAQFDNTNSIFSDMYSGTRYDSGQLPLEGGAMQYRHALWLALDRAYKTAVEGLGRKSAALQGVSVQEPLPDLAPAPPTLLVRPATQGKIDGDRWRDVVKKASAEYRAYPAVTTSNVDLSLSAGTVYFVNSAGTMIRTPDSVAILQTRAGCQAEDGMVIYDGGQWVASDPGKLPGEAELAEAVREVGERLTALTKAPLGKSYAGPVLFEPRAAAQLVGEVLGSQLCATRRPVAEPGRTLPFAAGEYESRINSRVLPEWLSVIDDPEAREWEGTALAGHYEADLEGVRPERLTVIEKGVLKTLLTTRQPVRGVAGSNGRARLPGALGVKMPRPSNLIMEAAESVPLGELRGRLLTMVRDQQKEFGLLVRKMDFPSAGSLDDLRRLGQRVARGGGGRAISLPLGIYRVTADGREELVRGLRFRGLTTRSFRDIVAASAERAAYHYVDNGLPLALMGAGSYVVGCSVVAPGLLFEELELEAIEEEFPDRPLVPPPATAG